MIASIFGTVREGCRLWQNRVEHKHISTAGITNMADNLSIKRLVQEIDKRFGSDIFMIQPSDDPNVVGFKSTQNEQLYISVVTTGLAPGRYSVQVTLEGENHKVFIGEVDNQRLYIPFEIMIDKEVNFEEMIKIFEEYRASQ